MAYKSGDQDHTHNFRGGFFSMEVVVIAWVNAELNTLSITVYLRLVVYTQWKWK
jgi:hypothetical protein